MNLGDLSLACATALVDELTGAGIRHACLSPGSRSTPLALALDRHPELELSVQLDERSSAFVAVGIAKASGRPAIVATTSGTAAAELLPAVVEASQSRTPLVLLTADRPPRVRGTGANQTIVQPGLFGEYVRATMDLPVPTTDGQDAWWRQAAREALDAMSEDPIGPVHLNCPFEEPLTPSAAVEPAASSGPVERGERPPAELDPDETERLRHLVSGARGAVVIGGWPGELAEEASFWSRSVGWPVLAEPTSGARGSPESALRTPQALISSPAWIGSHRPEVVIQFGAHPTSRATEAFVASAEQLIVADRWHLDPDPERLATWRLAVDPGALRRALTAHPLGDGRIEEAVGPEAHARVRGVDPPPDGWLAAWLEADARADSTLRSIFLESDEPFEPRVAREVADWIPEGGRLFVGNSTPIRDLDLAMAPRGGLTVLANRGASGIDGLLSTAIGIAVARPHHPTVALLGDLSVLHDAGALLWNATRGVDLTIVVLNNGGGHVFSLLPQRELPEHERLFVTPHAVDLGALCRAAGAGHERVERARDLLPALDRAAGAGIRAVEVAIDADLGLRRRQALRDEVDRVLTA